MMRLAKLTSFFMAHRGFSIGIGDVRPSATVLGQKARLVEEGYAKCEALIRSLATGELVAQPGCTPAETLEMQLNSALSDIREAAGKMCRSELPDSNAPLIMARCGSKGSELNMSQVIRYSVRRCSGSHPDQNDS